MKFLQMLEEKIVFLLFQIAFIFTIGIFLNVFGIPKLYIFTFIIIFLTFTFLYLGIYFYQIKQKENRIKQQLLSLEEKYLIAEVLERPKNLENQGYYNALKKACKAMNDKITHLEKEQKEYEEYIESFAHEMKTPIAVLSLETEKKKEKLLQEEIKKIDNLVEQMLYYARMKTTEKDYFVKKLDLEEVVHAVLLEYKDYVLKQKITLEVRNTSQNVYTDEKWLSFILSQILQNAIKYQNKTNKKIKIEAKEQENKCILQIEDNGCGIAKKDITRIFEPSFTGDNRKNKQATGMGLYLAKKLCDKLGLKLIVTSIENKYTRVEIVFPKGKMHNLEQTTKF